MKNDWTRLIISAGILGLAAVAAAQSEITGLTRHYVGDGVELKVVGTGLGAPHSFRARHGRALIVEWNATLEGPAKSVKVNKAGVVAARLGWFKHRPDRVRLLVELNQYDTPLITKLADGYAVSVAVDEATILDSETTSPTDQQGGITANGVAATSVSPKVVATTEPRVEAPVAKKPAPRAEAKVSLDFVNTDVVQILKALAMQANVNIVTSPELSPATKGASGGGSKKITVSLDNVRVNDALDFITALAGLRYAKVDNSYVVTSRDEFSTVMNDLADRTSNKNTVRIVPILSGDGAAIKDSVESWFGPSTLEVKLPTDKVSLGSPASPGAAAPPAGAPAGAAPAGPSEAAKPGNENVPYVILIGQGKWVDQAEKMVQNLDENILEAKNRKQAVENAVAEQTKAAAYEQNMEAIGKLNHSVYTVQNGKADDLWKSVEAQLPGVSVIASPKASKVQTLVLTGDPVAVKNATDVLSQLDTDTMKDDDFYVYNVKFGDPRALREDLAASMPGLNVTIPPASAGATRVYTEGKELSQDQQSAQLSQGQQSGAGAGGAAGGGAGGTSSAGSSGGATAPGVKGDNGQVNGLAQPFQGDEPFAPPMRLMLRGTHEKIADALKYLAAVDVRPKQLALELRVMELTKEDALQLGINWSVLTGGAVKTINLNESQGGLDGALSPANTVTGHIGLNRKIGADVTATLDAISNKNNLISRPNLLAMDGRESEIFVGDDIRYVESIVSSQTGPTIQSDDLQVGVRLSVLPRIGAGGNITMDLRPVVSFLKGFNSTSQNGVTLNLPQTSLRISQSTVNVQSGETLAIGGLIQDQDVYNLQKVPLLGDLPVLGQLFRSTSHTRQRTEIVFFLTVHEVGHDDRKDAADPRTSEKSNPGELPIPKRDLLK